MAARRKPFVRPRPWLTGRDAVWSTIRRLGADGAEFTLTEIEMEASVSRDTARDYLRELTAGGLLTAEPRRAENGSHQPTAYRLVRDIGIETPRFRADGSLDTTPTDQERLWAAMKALSTFTAADLQAGTGIANAESVKSYLKHLHRAGYFAVVEPGNARRQARYRLLPSRNTGPRPPAICRGKVVFDLNLGRQVWPQPEEGGR